MPILDGHAQPGPDQKRCYGCGGLGHVRGDPKCTAAQGSIWKGAPEGFKRRMETGAHYPKSKGKGGKGKGGTTQRNAGKRKADVDTSKLPCHNWSRGNGFCKYAEACRYSHAGPKGRSANKTTLATTVKRAKKIKLNLLLWRYLRLKLKGLKVLAMKATVHGRTSLTTRTTSTNSSGVYHR